MMRRLVVNTLVLFALPIAANAHGDARTLGHHWEAPAYINEIHTQVAAMVALGVAAAAAGFVARALKSRKVGNQ